MSGPTIHTEPVGTAGPVQHGFPGLPCPTCGQGPDEPLRVHVGQGSLYCSECDEEMPAADLRVLAQRYLALADWLDAMPYMPESVS